MRPLSTTTAPLCPECRRPGKLVTGAELYPHRPDLAHTSAWVCWDHDTRVGCHPGTNQPLGDMASRDVRQARGAVHRAFDPHWRNRGKKARGKARVKFYAKLAKALGLQPEECHVGMFNVAQCELALVVIASWGPPPAPPP